MIELKKIRSVFEEQKEKIFDDKKLLDDPYAFCIRYSLLVEEYIVKLVPMDRIGCALASAGSFSRRELSPYSDIDIMFIFSDIDGKEDEIQSCVTHLWDAGIEVSHTVRTFSDIGKFINEDLHTLTQFFETRFILGDENTYKQWNKLLFDSVTEVNKPVLLKKFFSDIDERHQKYGDSPKMLEPNVKFTCGGLRDLQAVEWMFGLANSMLLSETNEITQTQSFIKQLIKDDTITRDARNRLLNSYGMILKVRNMLHLITKRKSDRLEFSLQEEIANYFQNNAEPGQKFMNRYFEAANILNRFSKTMVKSFKEQISEPISDYLFIELDNDFSIKGKVISLTHNNKQVTLSDIMRAFYYRGLYDARFDKILRWMIIETVQNYSEDETLERFSSVFFREILRLPKNVGKTLSIMNELGVVSAYMPEFKELVGFYQPGVYHCYTADEHTLIALKNVEEKDGLNTSIGKIFSSIKEKDLLYLSILFHDIAKPINVGGHEIIGAEIANSVMERWGYEPEEIALVRFLVRHHLTMEQTAFRRNLNDPKTLNDFTALFPFSKALDFLYLLTYADLSAVSPAVWTHWKGDLLNELYRKSKVILDENISGEELLHAATAEVIVQSGNDSSSFREHIESINDLGYLQHFSEEEINMHIVEIQKGSKISVFFKTLKEFTNITIITLDSESLLSRLCGALSINDLNIHGAKIFTRADGIVIDSFSVTDFRNNTAIEENRFDKIRRDLLDTVDKELQIIKEFSKVKNKWWRLESKLFSRKGKIKIEFEKHDKYTIIDIFSPDRLGLLYEITKKMNDLGLNIHLAKISTKADDVVDTFYTLDRAGKKISPDDYELIRVELTSTIEEMI